jgi:hypothetical protein
MPDHINDIPLEQLLIYEDGELIFDGSDPDTFVVLEPGTASARLADLIARRDRRAVAAARPTSALAAARPLTPPSIVS